MTTGAGHDFKRTGVQRGGFEYQDLVAVDILIKFLRNPNHYEWVQVEAEDKAYQAIDDVVACRKDGQLELTQVKFTPDPLNPDRALSWEWLTRQTPHGTSLLQKCTEFEKFNRSACPARSGEGVRAPPRYASPSRVADGS